ncbi:MAG: nicotinate-nucleotide--dimethylbenzimidazole phosphoribosyltransferase [Lachnospiraceae bacterium]|nr:nicotinate-nucleotide--dimethylbenzimidazole phosphoribosyltransferase [Lachnospiraceae bacterium]
MTKEELCKLHIEPLYETEQQKTRTRLDAIAKPLDGLGQFEKLLVQIAGITGTDEIRIDKRAILAMCADNGIVAEGVTQTSGDVTAIVAVNMATGRSSVNRMAAVGGTEVFATDVGIATEVNCDNLRNRKVRKGTADFLKETAMREAEALQAIEEGILWVRECKEQGYQILGTGEMGIGNTTTSTAVGCALLGLTPEEVTGRGAGLDDAGLARKKTVIARAIKKYDLYGKDALTVLRTVGGLDIAGIAGIFIGGALYRVPIVLDGMITAVAALVADRLVPGTRAFILASHLSKEPITRKIMEELGLHPVIQADLALGEGTGAAMLFPLLDMALTVYRENDSFDEMQIDAYERFENNR